LKREIRDDIAIDPIATIPELTERLNKRLNHSFDPRHIKRLRDKVSHQLIIESDRMQIENRMRITHETYRISRDALLEIIYSGVSSRDRVEAPRALVMLDLAVFKAELETGMFKNPIEALAKEIRYDPLPADRGPHHKRGQVFWVKLVRLSWRPRHPPPPALPSYFEEDRPWPRLRDR
jgi:hypothetical protein